MAYSLTFSDPTRTLTDDEVMAAVNNIINSVTTKLDAKLRD
jgi:phenylalanyl-tRNA synthetase beta subunit